MCVWVLCPDFIFAVCTEFNLGLVDRIRGRFLDYTKTSVEWNCDEFPEVGKPTVITLQVSQAMVR